MVLQLFKPRWLLAAEIVCLRQQLAVLQRTRKHPVLQDKDRRFWILMARLFSGWKQALIIVKPETVLEFAAYYNTHRPHRSLELKPPRPEPETASPISAAPPLRIIAEAVLGGLHHVYKRAA
jgi:hypothetical protein